jgi:hypothetical protein
VTTLLRCLATATALGVLAGCSSRPQGAAVAPEVTLLQDVNDLLRAAGTSGRLPAKVADLDRYKTMFPRGYEAVKTGNVVVFWGAPFQGEGDVGKNEVVVAYEKNVPAEGGHVLLSAGSVKKMTAAEFNAAPKAGPK